VHLSFFIFYSFFADDDDWWLKTLQWKHLQTEIEMFYAFDTNYLLMSFCIQTVQESVHVCVYICDHTLEVH